MRVPPDVPLPLSARVPKVLTQELRRAAPYAILLAVALGAIVAAGAHYSNAFPSEKAPYGWPGPASFENAVAMVRSDIVLAASLPALLLGAFALREREPGRDGPGTLFAVFGIHTLLLALGVVVAAAIGSLGAGRTIPDAWWAFVVAHSVLALSFYSLAFLAAAIVRGHALFVALSVWFVFLGVYDAVTRTIMFRQEGYHNLAAGGFPDWFWVAQGLSPLNSYTGILILWRPRFRDAIETAALKNAVLPSWLVPATFVALAAVLWMLLPLAIAQLSWWLRGRGARGTALSPRAVRDV
jgi:hypothetical protein